MKSCSDNNVRVTEPNEDPIEVGWIVLAVGVYLCHRSVAVSLAVEESRPHRATNPHIEGQGHHLGTSGSSAGCSEVGRAVVHDQNVYIGSVLLHLRDDIRDRPFLIPRGNGHQN